MSSLLRATQLPYPVAPCPSIALFSSDFAAAPPVVRLESVDELPTARVVTVAAPFSFCKLSNAAAWMPEFPVIVLSTNVRGLMAQDDRDFIWDTFGVPVFEYLLDSEGRLVARECEAHEATIWPPKSRIFLELSLMRHVRAANLREGCSP